MSYSCSQCSKLLAPDYVERVTFFRDNQVLTKLKCPSCQTWSEYSDASPKWNPFIQYAGEVIRDDGRMYVPIVTPSVISPEKPPLHIIFAFSDVLKLITLGFWSGAQRPGRILMGWAKTGETKEKVLAGMLRHLAALENGERISSDGEDHLQNFGCNAVMYIALTLRGLWK